MKVLLTSVCMTVALGLGAASACEWQKSVTASAAPTPAQELKAPAQASAVDPVLLASLDKDAALQASQPVTRVEITPLTPKPEGVGRKAGAFPCAAR